MSVFSKLNKVRTALQEVKLTKSGHNKFAGYQYFELGDFLPTINKLMDAVGLCGIVSFGTELATLTITDVDDNTFITITSPMAEANLKGCHPIQNLGAVETYTRRYLWVTALEIVEHDALDATTGSGNVTEIKKPGVHKPAHDDTFSPKPERVKELNMIAGEILSFGDDYELAYDYLTEQELDNDEKTWLYNFPLAKHSAVRTGITAVSRERHKQSIAA